MGRLNFLYCMDLPHRAKLVYLYLYDRENKDNVTWPGLNTIARELSLSRSTVKRATAKTVVRLPIGIIFCSRRIPPDRDKLATDF